MGCGATGDTEGEIRQKEETVSVLAGGGIEVGEVEGETEGDGRRQKEETVSFLLLVE